MWRLRSRLSTGNLKWQHPSCCGWHHVTCTIDGAKSSSFSDLLVYYPLLCVGIGFLRPFREFRMSVWDTLKGEKTFGNREKQFQAEKYCKQRYRCTVALLPQARLNVHC